MPDQDTLKAARAELHAAVEKFLDLVDADDEPGILNGWVIVYNRALIHEDADATGYLNSDNLSAVTRLGLVEALHINARRKWNVEE